MGTVAVGACTTAGTVGAGFATALGAPDALGAADALATALDWPLATALGAATVDEGAAGVEPLAVLPVAAVELEAVGAGAAHDTPPTAMTRT